jgi:arsenite methyltransferase
MKRNNDSKKRVKAQDREGLAREDPSGSQGGRSHDSLGYAKSIGYSEQEIESVPAGAAVTHGCGNPTVLAQLREGQTVLDLGCGGGLDAFLAALKVGPKGRVIGLDAAPESIEKAQASARAGNYRNVEFRAGAMERLPLPDDSVDVVISNCVINHASDKVAVFREAYRVLKPGGGMFVSDLVTTGKLPESVPRNANQLWAAWLAVAADRHAYLSAIEAGGFRTIVVMAEGPFSLAEADSLLRGRIISIQIKGIK